MGKGNVLSRTSRACHMPVDHLTRFAARPVSRAAIQGDRPSPIGRVGHTTRPRTEQASAQFTMTPAEAATRLGVHVNAVRQAIDAGRLGAWMKGGREFGWPARRTS